MKTHIITLAVISFLFIAGCTQKPPQPSEIYEKYRSSVVLIINKHYFKISLDNGMNFYYVFEDGKPLLVENEEEAIESASTSFGTGFIIDRTGKIATNRHVVFPSDDMFLLKDAVNNYMRELKSIFQKGINENESKQLEIRNLYNRYYDNLSYNEEKQLRESYYEKDNEIIEYKEYLDRIEFNPHNTTIRLERVKLGVVFDNTFVEQEDDFEGCVPVSKHNDENIDIAIIQLKSKRIPDYITDLVSLDEINNSKNSCKLDDDVYMIGFNHGISLANTQTGIKSQFTTGKITQEPDGERLLYSIPTLPGSSGSPVFNKWGNLIAINYAKTSDYQGFSFGIASHYLHSLYKNETVDTKNDNTVNTNTVENDDRSNRMKNVEDYSNRIESLLKAEERRDFNEIYNHFSEKIKRYWDIEYPSRDDLYERYAYIWSITRDSKNGIKKIDRIDKNNYILYTKYEYYNLKREEYKTVHSKLKFVFNDNGMVEEVYGLD